jgi:hypothetical protein
MARVHEVSTAIQLFRDLVKAAYMRGVLGGRRVVLKLRTVEDPIRDLVIAMVFAMIFAQIVVFHLNWILSFIAMLGVAFWFLTRNRISLSRVVGLTVQWRVQGEDREGIVLATTTPGYLTVQEAPFGAENIPIEMVRLRIADRLKYSWRS